MRITSALLIALTPVLLFAAASSSLAQDCKPEVADSVIAGIKLADPASAVKVIGSRAKGDVPVEEQDKNAKGEDISPPYVRYASKGGSQQIRLFMHDGDPVDSYAEVLVYYSRANPAMPHISVDAFATEHHIRLAMSEEAVTKLLGSCFTRDTTANATILKYVIDDQDHPLLKRSKMASYYARYVFRNGRLDRFAFGFTGKPQPAQAVSRTED